jgi:hypothetical protein
MYDVLVPDTPQKDADFAAAIAKYPVAVLAGEYRKESGVAERLSAYVREGGTLYMSASQLDLGFSTEVVGVRATGKAFAFSGDFFDRKGVKHAAEGEYDCEELELSPQAKVFLRDGEGRVLASVHRCGKGRVVVAAPKWLVPRMPADGNYAVHLTRTGRRRFSFIEHFLDSLQKTLFPVKVEGSAQFGLNRNSKGWWLWCFNNRGVKKFADAHQEIDHSFDSVLSIDVSRLGAAKCRDLISGRGAELKNGSFSWTLPAGELAVFELQKGVEK